MGMIGMKSSMGFHGLDYGAGGSMNRGDSMSEAVIVNRLVRWANWKMRSGVALGFKPAVNFYRLAGGLNQDYNQVIDSECIETDNAVNELPVMLRELIRIEYLGIGSDEQLKAECFGCCVRSFRKWRRVAHERLVKILKIDLTMAPLSEYNSVSCS